MAEPNEQWLPVVGWEGRYEVSDLGRVCSLDRRTEFVDGRVAFYRGRILVPVLHVGYPAVKLCRRQCVRRLVHHLVLEAFVGPCPPGMETLHGPGGRSDSRLANLRWGTRSDNQGMDRVRDGVSNRGEQGGSAKLTAAVVLECRERHAAGEPMKDLAREFGVDKSSMSMAIRGVNWGWLKHEVEPPVPTLPPSR